MKGLSLWCSHTNRTIELGDTLEKIRDKLKEHFIDVVNCGEAYENYEVDNVNLILNKEYDNSQEIINDFESLELDFIDDEILDYTSTMKTYKKAYNKNY